MRWKRSIVTVTSGHERPLNPLTSIHRLELRFKERVPASFVVLLEEKARQRRISGEWYRSLNRNRQLEYFDENVSVRVYPKSGTCRILPRRHMTFEDVRVHVEDVFAKALPTKALLSESFRRMRDGLQVVSRHRSFPVGPITPFKVNFYKPSLGLDILADGSHPEHLEVRETWPTWIPGLFELQRKNSMAVSEFAAQIATHLNVMRGIELAANRLNETIRRFQQLVGGESERERDARSYPSRTA